MRSDYTFGVTFSRTPLFFPLQFNFLSSDFDGAGSEAVDSQRQRGKQRVDERVALTFTYI